jgi:8-hydroxy-5-deazaflavin:NADPH oxidoreductase
MKVGILGSGDVARTLADGFLKHQHEVMIGSRDANKLADWLAKNPSGKTGTFANAAQFGRVVVLAVKGDVAAAALRLATPAHLAGKPVLDATNPIANLPPESGVLRFFTNHDQSLMERLQDEFPDAHLVKVFNSVGSSLMVNPQFAGGKPTMFICGNSEAAKRTTREILDQFGWETADMGRAEAARAIEPLCMLWCIPVMLGDTAPHAFKVLK